MDAIVGDHFPWAVSRTSQPEVEAGSGFPACHFPELEKDNRQWESSDVQSAKTQADWLVLMVEQIDKWAIGPQPPNTRFFHSLHFEALCLLLIDQSGKQQLPGVPRACLIADEHNHIAGSRH